MARKILERAQDEDRAAVCEILLLYCGAVYLSEKRTLVGEIGWVNNFNGHKRDDPLSGLLGIQFFITENTNWDAEIERGTNKAAPDDRVTTELTYLFKPELPGWNLSPLVDVANPQRAI